jgi:hypothetical protein
MIGRGPGDTNVRTFGIPGKPIKGIGSGTPACAATTLA